MLTASLVQAQTWSTLTSRPSAGVSNCMLLTDAGVMCQSGGSWFKLTPNSSGSYLNGTWSSIASLPSGYVPDAYASAVLADGRAVLVGGEYNNGSFVLTNMGAVYNPKTNAWTMLTPPTTGSPNNLQCLGDAPSLVLADGRLLVGSKLFQDMAALDPATLTWSIITFTGKTDGFNSEEGWTLLPDASFFALDVKNAPASERFLPTGPTTGVWAFGGNSLDDLHTPTTSQPLQAPNCPLYNPPGEVGPALLLPSGKVFAVGANGLTGIFTPPPANSTATGTWARGPQLPAGLNVEDGPGAVLPSGRVLFGASPGASGTGLNYFEFDGTSLISVPAPARASSDATYYTSLLVLPSGQVMFVDGSTTVQLYTPAASPVYDPSWAPTIASVPLTLNNATTYQISGTQFNGLTQASAFGDESQNASNYPLVRITNNASGHVFYAKTHDHSSMGVATGSTIVFTNFDVPANIEAGAGAIQVVANGIPSAAVAVTVVSTAPPAPTVTGLAPNQGPSSGGTAVTIAGANFVAGVSVTFGGTSATVTGSTATSIAVTAPAHTTGTVSVVVTNPDGQSATLANSFTYTAAPPSITGVSPTSGSRFGNTSVTISGSNFVSGAVVTFGGSNASVRSLSSTSIRVRTPSHAAGTVNVVVTNPSGQSATRTNGYTFR